MYFKIEHFGIHEYVHIDTEHDNMQETINKICDFNTIPRVLIQDLDAKTVKMLIKKSIDTYFQTYALGIVSFYGPAKETFLKICGDAYLEQSGVSFPSTIVFAHTHTYIEEVSEGFIEILKRNKKTTQKDSS